MPESILFMTISELLKACPCVEDFFSSYGFETASQELTVAEYIEQLSDDFLEDIGMDRSSLIRHLISFIENVRILQSETEFRIRSITIKGGQNKNSKPEPISVTFRTGEIISIVGPTGSGKSRLLEDIECMAQGDTPTKRLILLNGQEPDEEMRFSGERKLVAQLSQNMNFIMDLSVGDFLTMHAESRMVENLNETVQLIFETANDLAGETFDLTTPVTELSGGQSRALMIADTACLSASPIILIDEIENAGIDRRKALDLLVRKEKIILIATHDPVLALMADKRIIIKNGGMKRLIETTDTERKNLTILSRYDAKILALRHALRNGDTLDFEMTEYFKFDGAADIRT